MLTGFAASYLGRREVAAMVPIPDRIAAERTLLRVSLLRERQERGDGLPALEAGDLSGALARLGAEGGILEPEAILAFVPVLRGARTAKAALERDGSPDVLRELGAPLRPLPHLERAIDQVLEPSGEVKDTASPELRRIRRGREEKRERLRARMERLASRQSAPDAETLVTLREGRYVLALPQAVRGKVPGLVLDRSASGGTFFVEPLEAVEENNALRELDIEETVEIRRILADLTARLRAERESLKENWVREGELDALQARVTLAARWRGTLPRFGDEPRVALRGARHPLLLEARGAGRNWEEARRSVVPLAVALDATTRMLLITGPNMGGKTVALKSVGLLSALAQSGCLIPAEEGSVLPWVERWVVSLGDEQSLDRDLSTFAAHLGRWGEALALAGPGTFVLLDELGSGTDPAEGAALARSVLEGLADARSLGLVTTHLGILKGFAAETEGLANASMVFDPATRRPTYEIAVGVPGESHALEMARRLGFPEERVARAEALLPREERDVRRLLEDMARERARLAESRRALEEKVAEAERLQIERRRGLDRLLEERGALRTRSARQAREMVRRAEEILRRAEKGAKAGRRPPELGRGALAEEQARLARLETPRRPAPAGRPVERVLPGERYWSDSLAREVEALREPDGSGRVAVLTEGVKVTLPRGDLRETGGGGGGGETEARPHPGGNVPEAVEAAYEVDLRGLRVDEFLTRLDRVVDQALLAGLKEIRVIHGKGTGALRRAVEEYCRTHPGVVSARMADQWEGGSGATMITLEDG